MGWFSTRTSSRNRQCFRLLYHSGVGPPPTEISPTARGLSRFRVSLGPTRRGSIRRPRRSSSPFLQGGHNGGDLHFGPDGMLYISAGDAASPNPPDPLNTGQDISDLLSSILRIDVDLRDEGKNYAIPKDNPFVATEGARPEVWAYGLLTHPWRMSFDRKTGEVFVGDVGWELWESVHRVEKGGNYGWSAMEGPQPIKSGQVGPTPIRPRLDRVLACTQSRVASPAVGSIAAGDSPELAGGLRLRRLGDAATLERKRGLKGDRKPEMSEIARPSVRFVAFGEDRDGGASSLSTRTAARCTPWKRATSAPKTRTSRPRCRRPDCSPRSRAIGRRME